MKKRATAIMARMLPAVILMAFAALLAQAPAIEAQSSGGAQSLKEPVSKEPILKEPAPEGPTTEGQWVPGNHFSISMGCLKKWICDCSGIKAPRRARIERTPSESIAGICEPGARGACSACSAKAPPKKCECKTKFR